MKTHISSRRGIARIARSAVLTVATMVCAVTFMVTLAGCVGTQQEYRITTPGGEINLTGKTVNTVFVQGSGVCGNAAASTVMPTGSQVAMMAAFESRGGFDIVTVESSPRNQGMQVLGSDAASDSVRTSENSDLARQIWSGLASGGMVATSEEADPWASIAIAERELDSCKGPDNVQMMVISHSLIGTHGTVNFADGMTLQSDPQEVVEWVKSQGELIDLSGIDHILVYYCGDAATGSAQEKLSNADVNNLQAIWAALFEACGCTDVQFLKDQPSEPSSYPADMPKVTAVPVGHVGTFAASEVKPQSTVVLGKQNAVVFNPDDTTFVAPEEAEATIEALAQQIIDADVDVELEGNTAGSSGGEDLSAARAHVVADLLVKHGVPEGRIASVVGNGCHGGKYSTHVPDTAADGSMIPAKADENRTCVVAFV